MSFSIVIPTYNRPDKLLKVLNSLDNQQNHYVQILVIDNCSDTNVEEFLKFHSFKSLNLKILRNSGNVGLGGNILMAFLQCQTKWMWLLGDDDIPLSGAVDKVQNALKFIQEDIFALKFNSHAGGFPGKNDFFDVIDRLNCLSYLSNISYYSNFLFISNSIYNVELFRKFTFHMANGLRTIAPHVLASLNLLEDNKKIKLIDDFIIHHGRLEKGEANWSSARLISGVTYLYDSDIPDKFKQEFIPILLNNYISRGKKSTKNYLGFVLRNFERVEGQYFLHKAAGIQKGWFSLKLQIIIQFFAIPGVYDFLRKILVKNKKNTLELLRN